MIRSVVAIKAMNSVLDSVSLGGRLKSPSNLEFGVVLPSYLWNLAQTRTVLSRKDSTQ